MANGKWKSTALTFDIFYLPCLAGRQALGSGQMTNFLYLGQVMVFNIISVIPVIKIVKVLICLLFSIFLLIFIFLMIKIYPAV